MDTERIDKMVNMLTVACLLNNNAKTISIGGKKTYAQLSPSEIIKSKARIKSLMGSCDSLCDEVASIAGDDDTFKYEEFIKAVNEDI